MAMILFTPAFWIGYFGLALGYFAFKSLLDIHLDGPFAWGKFFVIIGCILGFFTAMFFGCTQ